MLDQRKMHHQTVRNHRGTPRRELVDACPSRKTGVRPGRAFSGPGGRHHECTRQGEPVGLRPVGDQLCDGDRGRRAPVIPPPCRARPTRSSPASTSTAAPSSSGRVSSSSGRMDRKAPTSRRAAIRPGSCGSWTSGTCCCRTASATTASTRWRTSSRPATSACCSWSPAWRRCCASTAARASPTMPGCLPRPPSRGGRRRSACWWRWGGLSALRQGDQSRRPVGPVAAYRPQRPAELRRHAGRSLRRAHPRGERAAGRRDGSPRHVLTALAGPTARTALRRDAQREPLRARADQSVRPAFPWRSGSLRSRITAQTRRSQEYDGSPHS